MIKKFFCWAFLIWGTKILATEQSLVVRVLNLFKSDCKYCQMTRWAMAGLGLGLIIGGHLFTGAGIILSAYLLTLGERYWLCEVKT